MSGIFDQRLSSIIQSVSPAPLTINLIDGMSAASVVLNFHVQLLIGNPDIFEGDFQSGISAC